MREQIPVAGGQVGWGGYVNRGDRFIAPNEAPDCLNVYEENGVLKKRKGYNVMQSGAFVLGGEYTDASSGSYTLDATHTKLSQEVYLTGTGSGADENVTGSEGTVAAVLALSLEGIPDIVKIGDVMIYASDANGHPTGSMLGLSDISFDTSYIINNEHWYIIPISSLNINTNRLCIVLYISNPTESTIKWHYSDTGYAPGGARVASYWDGAAWQDIAGVDFKFKFYYQYTNINYKNIWQYLDINNLSEYSSQVYYDGYGLDEYQPIVPFPMGATLFFENVKMAMRLISCAGYGVSLFPSTVGWEDDYLFEPDSYFNTRLLNTRLIIGSEYYLFETSFNNFSLRISKYTAANNYYRFANTSSGLAIVPDNNIPQIWGSLAYPISGYAGNFTFTGLTSPIVRAKTVMCHGNRVWFGNVIGINSTTVNDDSAAGQKVLNVASVTGYEAGQQIVINLGGAREEYAYIDSVGVATLTLTTNLRYEHTGVQADAVDTCYHNRIYYSGIDTPEAGYSNTGYISVDDTLYAMVDVGDYAILADGQNTYYFLGGNGPAVGMEIIKHDISGGVMQPEALSLYRDITGECTIYGWGWNGIFKISRNDKTYIHGKIIEYINSQLISDIVLCADYRRNYMLFLHNFEDYRQIMAYDINNDKWWIENISAKQMISTIFPAQSIPKIYGIKDNEYWDMYIGDEDDKTFIEGYYKCGPAFVNGGYQFTKVAIWAKIRNEPNMSHLDIKYSDDYKTEVFDSDQQRRKLRKTTTADNVPIIIKVNTSGACASTEINLYQNKISTTVNGDSNSGQTVLNVASIAGFLAGHKIRINTGGVREETAVISSVGETSLTLTANLTYTHTAVQADTVYTYDESFALSELYVEAIKGAQLLEQDI